MAMSDNIKREVTKQTPLTSDTILDSFNNVVLASLEKFMLRLANGQIEMNDFVDLQRVYTMAVEINGFKEMGSGDGSGALPELRSGEFGALKESGIVSEDGENVDLSEKSRDELNEMALKLMNAVNNENAGEM